MKIAIIGSGISGLATSWLLSKAHDITLYEKASYLGGHANTVDITYAGKNIAVDTGFIVFNFQTYPNLKAFFELLNVEIEKSDMSFGMKDLDRNFEYSGSNLKGLFADKRNLLNLKFYKMLKDILKFNKYSIKLIESNKDVDADVTLFDFINDLKLGDYFKDYYLFPMAGAIWSCPIEVIKNYPAKTFLQFFYNHGLLTVINQPQWYTVSGGSKEYVKKIRQTMKGDIKLNQAVKSVQKLNEKIEVTEASGNKELFDHVVFASHPDQTLTILADKTKEEQEILSQITYNKNTAFLHKDLKQMPNHKNAYASWVYLYSKNENKVSLSYWMNNLQNIDNDYPLFVTLNPINEIHQDDVFGVYEYEHPVFDNNAIKAQDQLGSIQGTRNIWYCGAWTKYGFHEDGLNSAINIAKKFGVEIPWQQ